MRKDLLPTTFEGALSKVVEECGEVLHVIGKIQRHGRIATDPVTLIKYDNMKDFWIEEGQLQFALEECERLYYKERDAEDEIT